MKLQVNIIAYILHFVYLPSNVGHPYNRTIILFTESTRDADLIRACLLILPGTVNAKAKDSKAVRRSLKENQNSFLLIAKVRIHCIRKCS